MYQDVVHPSGSHVPSQRLANELVATAAIMNAMLTTNSVIRPSSSPRQARSNHAEATCRFIWGLAFAAGNRAAIEQVAQSEHRGDDDQLHEAHDHCDRRGQRIVVLLECRLVRRDRYDPRRTRGRTQQHRGRAVSYTHLTLPTNREV